jgi:hypothetical protein
MSYLYSGFSSNFNSSAPDASYSDLISYSSIASSSGVLYLGNLLIQWGTTVNLNSGSAHSLDLIEPYSQASDYMVVGVPGSGSNQDGTGITMINSNNTASAFQMRVWGGEQVGVNWLAIGKKPS